MLSYIYMSNPFHADKAFIQLKENFKKGNISHAYLFVSPDELNNSLFTKELSKVFLCDNKDGCNTCPSCLKSLASTNPDILVYPKDKSFVVDDANDINIHALEKPMISERKIIIINNIDNSTIQAQNKILKTLEEPPKSVVFMLTAKNENKILPTIISRTRKINLRPLSEEDLKNYISDSMNPERDILMKALKYGEGWIGKTISALNEQFVREEILAKEIARDFNSSKNISNVSAKVLAYKDNFSVILELLTKQYNEILINAEDDFTKEGAVKIIEYINTVNENFERNVNINLLADNLLMKILEIKYLYQMQT